MSVGAGLKPGRLFGFSGDDVWSGNLRWNGSTWSISEAPHSVDALWGSDPDNLWSLTNYSAKVMRHGP